VASALLSAKVAELMPALVFSRMGLKTPTVCCVASPVVVEGVDEHVLCLLVPIHAQAERVWGEPTQVQHTHTHRGKTRHVIQCRSGQSSRRLAPLNVCAKAYQSILLFCPPLLMLLLLIRMSSPSVPMNRPSTTTLNFPSAPGCGHKKHPHTLIHHLPVDLY
jgi:hypothetical protein